MKNLSKYQGCLIGGAVGDALGYAVEFKGLSDIVISNTNKKARILYESFKS